MTYERAERGTSSKVRKNLAGDRYGKPDWYTHFGSRFFAESALTVFQDEILERYPEDRMLTIVGLGSGTGLYDAIVTQHLNRHRRTLTVATDLQQYSSSRVPDSDLPLERVSANITQLPILSAKDRPDSFGGILALSRAVEHYLTDDELTTMITETGRILSPGELYIAQISSGSPLALKSLSEGIRAIGGKEETFLSPYEYKEKVKGIKQLNGRTPIFEEVITDTTGSADNKPPIFEEVTTGYAETQTGRNSVAQARRYLNQHFLELHASTIGSDMEQYETEIAAIAKLRNALGHTVRDETSRVKAIAELDQAIESTTVYQFFKNIYLRSILDYLEGVERINITPGLELPGMRIIGDNGTITDIELDMEYPIVVWKKNKEN